jgi:hypothetical protein
LTRRAFASKIKFSIPPFLSLGMSYPVQTGRPKPEDISGRPELEDKSSVFYQNPSLLFAAYVFGADNFDATPPSTGDEDGMTARRDDGMGAGDDSMAAGRDDGMGAGGDGMAARGNYGMGDGKTESLMMATGGKLLFSRDYQGLSSREAGMRHVAQFTKLSKLDTVDWLRRNHASGKKMLWVFGHALATTDVIPTEMRGVAKRIQRVPWLTTIRDPERGGRRRDKHTYYRGPDGMIYRAFLNRLGKTSFQKGRIRTRDRHVGDVAWSPYPYMREAWANGLPVIRSNPRDALVTGRGSGKIMGWQCRKADAVTAPDVSVQHIHYATSVLMVVKKMIMAIHARKGMLLNRVVVSSTIHRGHGADPGVGAGFGAAMAAGMAAGIGDPLHAAIGGGLLAGMGAGSSTATATHARPAQLWEHRTHCRVAEADYIATGVMTDVRVGPTDTGNPFLDRVLIANLDDNGCLYFSGPRVVASAYYYAPAVFDIPAFVFAMEHTPTTYQVRENGKPVTDYEGKQIIAEHATFGVHGMLVPVEIVKLMCSFMVAIKPCIRSRS